MKCPRCFALNCDSDDFCIGCRGPLGGFRVAVEKQKRLAATPQFAYFFAAVCAAIPIATLGGCIPVALGLGGAGLCMGISRAYAIPAAVRFVACMVVSITCWIVFVAIVIAMFPTAKKRLDEMLGRG